jgi:hypothetical protein
MTRKRKITVDQWQGCYPSSWKGVIVPEAMSHPAKYSSKLIRRIYEHMLTEGWVQAGDSVLDPFGGVALGALDAMRLGLNWTGSELEEKFFKLGNENIARWNTQYRSMPNWGTARLLHGDSRQLLSVIGDAVRVSVSSPPYADSDQNYKAGWERFHDGHTPLHTNDIQREAEYGQTPGQLSAMPAQQFDAAISSPPYAETDLQYKKNGLKVDGKDHYERPYMNGQGDENYGETPGQLGAMRGNGFNAAISSPPFLQSEGGAHVPSNYADDPTFMARHAAGNKSSNAYGESAGQLSSMRDGGFAGAVSSPPFAGAQQVDNRTKPSSAMSSTWKKRFGDITDGQSDGQLANMPTGDFKAALSSPPYAEARIGQESGQEHCGTGDQYGGTEGQLGSLPADEFAAAVSSPPFEDVNAVNDPKYTANRTNGGGPLHGEYGNSAGQLGNDSGQDFWLAARAIVEQVYAALAPGAHAIWVTKDYVKNKSIVPFSHQWQQLCEAVGFVTLHEHHAMLVHHKGTQHLLEGGSVERKTESKSFFRRLAEKKGSPRIDWETVFCMVKPE